MGTTIGVIKGDTSSLDYSSWAALKIVGPFLVIDYTTAPSI